ncbi:HNH endonuclease [Arthrobacter sp. TE12232]
MRENTPEKCRTAEGPELGGEHEFQEDAPENRFIDPSFDEEVEAEFAANWPNVDRDWSEDDWAGLLEWLIDQKIVTMKEVAALVLGQLNPSQVGTSIASKKTFQAHYPPRKTMQAVYEWHNAQSGRCADCGTRLDLQADHVIPREELGDNADYLGNMTLRCRRCNVIRRPSHKRGGMTFLTAEAALMWLLFVKKPYTYQEYERLCRAYGMTMANVRFHEAWAMAHWLQQEGLYEIAPDSIF